MRPNRRQSEGADQPGGGVRAFNPSAVGSARAEREAIRVGRVLTDIETARRATSAGVMGARFSATHHVCLHKGQICRSPRVGDASRTGIANGDFRCESTFEKVEGTIGRGARNNRAEFNELLHRYPPPSLIGRIPSCGGRLTVRQEFAPWRSRANEERARIDDERLRGNTSQ